MLTSSQLKIAWLSRQPLQWPLVQQNLTVLRSADQALKLLSVGLPLSMRAACAGWLSLMLGQLS